MAKHVIVRGMSIVSNFFFWVMVFTFVDIVITKTGFVMFLIAHWYDCLAVVIFWRIFKR